MECESLYDVAHAFIRIKACHWPPRTKIEHFSFLSILVMGVVSGTLNSNSMSRKLLCGLFFLSVLSSSPRIMGSLKRSTNKDPLFLVTRTEWEELYPFVHVIFLFTRAQWPHTFHWTNRRHKIRIYVELLLSCSSNKERVLSRHERKIKRTLLSSLYSFLHSPSHGHRVRHAIFMLMGTHERLL